MEIKKQLMETSWFHAANFIWLYDATGLGWKKKSGIVNSVQINIGQLNPNQKYKVLNKCEKIAILLPENRNLHLTKSKDSMRLEGETNISDENLKVTEDDLSMPSSQVTLIDGTINDSSNTYNPRKFSLSLNQLDVKNITQNSILLYKNASRISRSSPTYVYGNLVLENNDPVPWALLKLEVTRPDDLETTEVDESETWTFLAQSNQFGDFVIPLDELPASSINSINLNFTAKLTVKKCVLVDQFPDPDSVNNLNIKIQDFEDENSFLDEVIFTLSHGNDLRIPIADENKPVVVKL